MTLINLPFKLFCCLRACLAAPRVCIFIVPPAAATLPCLALNNSMPSPIFMLSLIMPHTVSLSKSAAALPNRAGNLVKAPRSSLMIACLLIATTSPKVAILYCSLLSVRLPRLNSPDSPTGSKFGASPNCRRVTILKSGTTFGLVNALKVCGVDSYTSLKVLLATLLRIAGKSLVPI